MALPNLSNQFINVNTFTTALQCPDAKKIARVKLKRRYGSTTTPQYDTDWTTITSYLMADGIGDIDYGVDDEEWITGLVRNANVDLEFDNTEGKFNARADSNSLWYSTYYIPNSLVEVDFGFELPTGTQYFSATPFISGLISADSVQYTERNTFKCTLLSKLDYLKTKVVSDFFTFKRYSTVSGTSILEKVQAQIADGTIPTALSLSVLANSPRDDIQYEKLVDQQNVDMFTFISNFAKDSGSIFGINRTGELFLTYFGNPYYQATATGLAVDSTTVAYYKTYMGGYVRDDSGYNQHLSTSGAFINSVTAKFGAGFYLNVDTASWGTSTAVRTDFTMTSNLQTFEVLFKIDNYYAESEAGINSLLKFTQSNALPNVDDLVSIGEKQLKVSTKATTYLQQPYMDKQLLFGEGQWNYFASVNDAASRTYYLNGSAIATEATATAAGSVGTCQVTAHTFADFTVDSIRISNVAKTADDIKNQNAKIFTNKLQFTSSSVYDFYNYGINSNIYSLESYNNGYSKLYNKVTVKEDIKYDNYYMKCDVWLSTATTSIAFYPQVQMGNNFFYTNAVVLTDVASLPALIDLLGNGMCVSTITMNKTPSFGTLIVRNTVDNQDAINKSYVQMLVTWGTYAFTAPAYYYTLKDTLNNKIKLQYVYENVLSDYVFVNTASTIEYGERIYELKDKILNSYSLTANMANSILGHYATPKITMKIKTRFLEGDLDLLKRVTVHWQADTHNQNVTNTYTDNAGAITWGTKDFYITGINHSWQSNETTYSLKEV